MPCIESLRLLMFSALVAAVTTQSAAQQTTGTAASPTLLGPTDTAIAIETRVRALEKTPSRTVVAWRGTSAGIRGSVTPLRTYLARNGMFCREFEETTIVPTATVTENHLACRDANGAWLLAR